MGFPAVYNDIVGEAFAAERRVDGNSHYSEAMALELDHPPGPVPAFLMRFTQTAGPSG